MCDIVSFEAPTQGGPVGGYTLLRTSAPEVAPSEVASVGPDSRSFDFTVEVTGTAYYAVAATGPGGTGPASALAGNDRVAMSAAVRLEGGELRASNGEVTLVLAPGAFSTSTTVTVTESLVTSVGRFMPLGGLYDISPSGPLGSPATLSIAAAPGVVQPQIAGAMLQVAKIGTLDESSGTWRMVEGSHARDGRVIGELTHFSYYTPIAPSPHGASADKLAYCSSGGEGGAPLCHSLSSETNAAIRLEARDPQVCYYCHGNDPSSSESFAVPGTRNIEAEFYACPGQTLPGTQTTHPAGIDQGMYCTTCHDPHMDPTVRSGILRAYDAVTGAAVTGGAEFCWACHGAARNRRVNAALQLANPETPGYDYWANTGGDHKTGYATSGHAGATTSGAVSCNLCHAEHGAATADLLRGDLGESTPASVADDRVTGAYGALCLDCHDGGMEGAADIKRYVTHGAADTSMWESGGHRVKSAGATLPVDAPLPCTYCHGTHGSSRGNKSLLSDTLGSGLDTTSGAGVRRFCLSCHLTSDLRGWNSATGTYAVIPPEATVAGLLRNGGLDGSGPGGQGYNWLRLRVSKGHASADVQSCYTCHGAEYGAAGSSNVHDPEIYSTAKHAVAGPCTATGCHAADAFPIHTDPAPGPRCSSCHAPDKTPSRACRSCHAEPAHPVSTPWHGTSEVCSSCHATSNLMDVHGDDCQACHSPQQGLTYTGTCMQAGCHASRHLSFQPDPGHPSDHGEGSDCWDCHDGWPSWCSDCHYYDRTPPVTTTDARASYLGAAVIRLNAVDAAAGASGIRATYFQIDGGPLHTGSLPWVPGPASGSEIHTLEYWSMDNGFNTETHHIVSFTVVAGSDTVAPTGTMSINNGAAFANSTGVNVTSAVIDVGTGVMSASIDPGTGTFGPWVEYNATLPITLPAGNGVKTVSVRYMDAFGNILTLSDTIVVDVGLPVGTMLINSGDPYANSTAVTINSAVSDALSGISEMQFSNNASWGWSGWTAYSATAPWTLSTGSGNRFVYAQYRDAAGNVLQLVDVILLDAIAPTGTMSINNGAVATTSTTATVNSSITDSGGSLLSQMRVDPGSGEYGSWIAYSSTYSITLAPGDGVKTVRAEYRDKAGNVLSRSDTILMDTEAPFGTMVIAEDAESTPVRWVTVDSAMTDTTSGVFEMCVDPGTGTYGPWVGYVPTYAIELASGDGLKTVRVQYRDHAGMVTMRTDTITLAVVGSDTEPPTGSVVIDAEAPTTASTTVALTPSAADTGGSGVSHMRFSNDRATWSAWEVYDTSRTWTLTTGDGTKTVYVQYRDGNGNVSDISTDTIVLYSTPTSGTISLALTQTTWVDANPQATGPWGTYSIYVNDVLLGTKYAGPDPTWVCPGVDLPAGGHIDIVADVGFTSYSAPYWDWVKPHTYTLTLPAGTTRLESATWTGFSSLGYTDDGEYYPDYGDIWDGAYLNPCTITNIVYNPGPADTTAPTGSMTIGGGAAYTAMPSVALALAGNDTGGSGLSQMRFSNDNVTWTRWEAFASAKAWTLTSGDGLKTVYVQLADRAGNIRSTSDTITLDTTAPTGTVVINNGDPSTSSLAAALTVSASDPGGSGVTAMRFSNDNVTWSSWQAYATTKTWNLAPGAGDKTVYVQFRDQVLNLSGVSQDSIRYEMVLSYTADVNGTISGTSPQVVPFGNSGTTITAVPSAGYHFLAWSDGSTANPRTDVNVQANVNATAWFGADGTHTTTFLTDGNGYVSGQWKQAVSRGGSSVSVTAVSYWDDYAFSTWYNAATNTYVGTPTLSLTNVTGDQTWTAYFYWTGSCPFLYTWDGEAYRFEADEFAAGYLGLRTSKGYRPPNPLDYHVLATTPALKDGALEYKLVEERDETDYLDQVKLYTVDAPADREVYVERSQAEGVGLFTTLDAVIHTTARDLQPPPSVLWVNTGQDVREKLASSDGDYVVLNQDRNAGFSYQTLELDLGDVQDAPQVKLVMDGRTMIPSSPEGRAYSRLFTGQVKFEVQDSDGNWVAVPKTTAILPKPPEFTRPFVLDLTNVWISDSRKVRLTYLYKTYFDSILLDTTKDVPVSIDELALESADLEPHGFNLRTGIGELFDYVYGTPFAPPRYKIPGNYTRFGDVTPLLDSIDDKFVIFGGGDELTLRFADPGASPENTTRRFLFLSDGYYKTLKEDIAHTVEPLPFAAMSTFPYPDTESYPTDADHEAYLSEWNTRVEGSP